MKPYQTLQQRPILQTPWFSLRQDDILLPNGQQIVYNVIEKPEAVIIVPMLATGEVVLIHQYRYPLDGWCYEVPAGSIAPTSTPLATAQQELLEEIGGSQAEWVSLGQYWTMKSLGRERSHFFMARNVQLGQAQHEATEFIQLKIVSTAEALQMARTGLLADAHSALAVLLCEPYWT
jgi:ADP-ribose pyrophosphatase